nr:hypothetical protein [Acidobacteriota bacterium]
MVGRSLAFVSAALLLLGPAASTLAHRPLIGQDQSGAAHATPGAAVITDAQLRDYLTFIASDLLEGRETPSRGLDIAAAFLSTQLARWGITPAGDPGSYLQKIALTRRRLDVDHTTLQVGTRPLVFGDDFLPGTVAGAADGGLVYVGHGYVVGARDLDPYRGLDVRGKIVVAHPGLPRGLTRQDLVGPRGEAWNDTVGAAAARGATAVLWLADHAQLSAWPDTRASLPTRGEVTVDAFDADPDSAALP